MMIVFIFLMCLGCVASSIFLLITSANINNLKELEESLSKTVKDYRIDALGRQVKLEESLIHHAKHYEIDAINKNIQSINERIDALSKKIEPKKINLPKKK